MNILTLTIGCGSGNVPNAAFDPVTGNPRGECVRLLREVAKRLEEGGDVGALFDTNGQRAGQFEYEEPEVDEPYEEATCVRCGCGLGHGVGLDSETCSGCDSEDGSDE